MIEGSDDPEFGVEGWKPSGFELDMVKRKVALLNVEHTIIFLNDCIQADPKMPLAEALIRARILFIETRISIEGATPRHTEMLRNLRAQLDQL